MLSFLARRRFKTLADEESFNAMHDLDDLVCLTRELQKENARLNAKVEELQSDRPTLRKIILGKIQAIEGPDFLAGFCVAAIAAFIFFVIYSIAYMAVNTGPTNRYYIQSEFNNQWGSCMRVIQEVDYGFDVGASECFQTTDEAITALIRIKLASGDDDGPKTDTTTSDGDIPEEPEAGGITSTQGDGQ